MRGRHSASSPGEGNDVSEFILSGLKVLDVGTFIASPMAATILADFGADVIKVEQAGQGDLLRMLYHADQAPTADTNYLWSMWNRNKRGLSLNFKSPDAALILQKLASECDVLITNMPSPLRDSLKLGYEEVKALNPTVIYASFSAFGEKGPDKDGTSFDFYGYWNRSGLMEGTRNPGTPPAQVFGAMGDQVSSISIYASIVTALLKRERTGKGSHVQTSLLANGVWAAGALLQGALAGADLDDFKTVNSVLGVTARIYQTRDDRWLQLSLLRTEEMFLSLLSALDIAEVLEDEQFATPEKRQANKEVLSDMLQDAFLKKDSAEWIQVFKSVDLPVPLAATLKDVITDEQLRANDMVIPPAHDDMDLSLLISHPINIGTGETVGPTPAPDVGEHTDEILTELGCTADEIEKYRNDGTV